MPHVMALRMLSQIICAKEIPREQGDETMETGIHENSSNSLRESYHTEIPERRLWAAVLLQAIEDWRSSNMRRRREAEKFLFSNGNDFATVCQGIGLEPSVVLAKLRRARSLAPQSIAEKAARLQTTNLRALAA